MIKRLRCSKKLLREQLFSGWFCGFPLTAARLANMHFQQGRHLPQHLPAHGKLVHPAGRLEPVTKMGPQTGAADGNWLCVSCILHRIVDEYQQIGRPDYCMIKKLLALKHLR